LCKIHGFHTASCRHACQSQNNWVSHFYKWSASRNGRKSTSL
jgi:hypothetical protein